MNCPICNSENTLIKSMNSRTGEVLEIVQCKHCLHYAQPIQNYEEVYTTGQFSIDARGEQLEPAPSKIQALDHTAWLRYNYYKNYFSDCSSVLEIGSAIGSFVHLLKMNGIDAEGLEPDPGYAH